MREVDIYRAGIAGPMLAYWLGKAGHEVLLVEASARLRSGGCIAAFEVEGYRPRDELVYVRHGIPSRPISRFSMRDDKTLFLRPPTSAPRMNPARPGRTPTGACRSRRANRVHWPNKPARAAEGLPE
jgi:phytoene dehydrogenase-like protein